MYSCIMPMLDGGGGGGGGDSSRPLFFQKKEAVSVLKYFRALYTITSIYGNGLGRFCGGFVVFSVVLGV